MWKRGRHWSPTNTFATFVKSSYEGGYKILFLFDLYLSAFCRSHLADRNKYINCIGTHKECKWEPEPELKLELQAEPKPKPKFELELEPEPKPEPKESDENFSPTISICPPLSLSLSLSVFWVAFQVWTWNKQKILLIVSSLTKLWRWWFLLLCACSTLFIYQISSSWVLPMLQLLLLSIE